MSQNFTELCDLEKALSWPEKKLLQTDLLPDFL